ncbi:MAG: glycosyltransferase family 4 protein [Thaumarchaeota archaeon]|nr:glycosyltransferase family 4 protein [Nitrososphaerota archaeon]
MKICYVAADVAIPHYRGSSTHVYEVAKNLARLGNEVHVVARRVSSSEAQEEALDGIRIHRFYRGIFLSSKRSSFVDLGARGSYRGATPRLVWKSYEVYLKTAFPAYIAAQVVGLIRKYSIDLIFERETSFGAGALASLLTGRPFVLEVIGNRVTRLQMKRSEKIIVYSHSIFEEIADRSKVVEVTAAVDTDLFKPDPHAGTQVRRKYSLGDLPVVGYVGTFQEWHGMDQLIHAAQLVLRRRPEVKFLMVGPYFTETQRKVRVAGIESSFVFTGPVAYEQVPSLMNSSNVLVAPYDPSKISSSEQIRRHGLGSPLKVFEYMSVGKPTITTDVKPISDPVQDGVTGILIKPGDAAGLGAGILRLLEDEEEADRIGAAGRRSVVANYSWARVAKQMSQVFAMVLRSGGSERESALVASINHGSKGSFEKPIERSQSLSENAFGACNVNARNCEVPTRDPTNL